VPVALFPSNASFPCRSARSASTSSFSRPAQRLLALQPAHSRSHLMTLYIGGFSRVVAFPTASIATGRSDPCRKGFAPSQEPCLSTAHAYSALSPVTNSFCHRHLVDRRLIRARLGRWPPRDLTPATGARTTRLRRPQQLPLVLRADHRSRGFQARPATSPARATPSRPPHPAPNVRDDRDTPLFSGWDSENRSHISEKQKRFIFAARAGQEFGNASDLPVGQRVC
jgi:hypothetical protein